MYVEGTFDTSRPSKVRIWKNMNVKVCIPVNLNE